MSSSKTPGRIIPIADASGAGVKMQSLYASEGKIHARAVSGWFARWRWVMVWVTQIVFYGLPWLPWNGRQAVLFDLAARRFYIFELVLHPQDFIYLAALLILCAYSLFFFTAVAGRLWCGYACPQTVYTEIFMWVEHRTEGDRVARMRLDKAPWNLDKLWRRGGKHAIWIGIGLWTGFSFVGYFTPIRELGAGVIGLSLGPWEWFWVLFYGLATYGNAGFLREQVCKYMCPYARFQSAMFDRDTMIISYDPARGEPRGSRSRSADPKALGKGDCIDCTLCVQVCPTGIDIRKGLQYECIGCAACIDVCDSVMDKMNYPRGLIRYVTENGLEHRWSARQMWKRVARPRVIVLGLVLLGIATAFIVSLSLRLPLKVDVVRDRGALARMVEDGRIENVYRLQLMNASESPMHLQVSLDGIEGAQISSSPRIEVAPTESRWMPVRVQVPPEVAQRLGAGVHELRFRVERAEGGAGEPFAVIEKSTFMVPR